MHLHGNRVCFIRTKIDFISYLCGNKKSFYAKITQYCDYRPRGSRKKPHWSDKMILQGHLFRDNEKAGELILDNNDIERERGITILSKNVSVNYKGYKINIIDTSGSLRLRRRGGTGVEYGRRCAVARGCLRGNDASDAIRSAEGLGSREKTTRGDQQGR